MPNKKKKSSAKGRKKKASGVSHAERSSRVSAAASADGNGDASWMDMLGSGMDARERQQSISRCTLYDEYKRATTSFKEGLISLVPSLGTKVHDFVVATDSLVERDKRVVPSNLLQTLRSAIRIRQRVALLYDTDRGGDPGHEYFIQVLQYCYQSLKPLSRDEKAEKPDKCTTDASGGQDVASISNKFQALSTDEPENDLLESEEEDEWQEQSVQRPEEPETDYFIDDLIDGSDGFHATAFLSTVNALVGEVAGAYANLKTICRSDSNKILGFELMKCAVVANEALQELRYAEQLFVAERPHLSSIYHILAAALLQPITGELLDSMTGSDQLEMRRAATKYIGDCLRIGFGIVNEAGRDRWKAESTEFSNQWQIELGRLTLISLMPKLMLEIELGMTDQASIKSYLGIDIWSWTDNGDRVEIPPNSWLLCMDQLSGGRSIVYTMLSIAQFLVKTDFLQTQLNFLGSEYGWQDISSGLCTTETLAHVLVPLVMIELCEKCGRGSLEELLPYEDHLLPILRPFREFCSVRDSEEYVSLSLVFALHILQIAVIELHGDDDLQKLSLAGKLSVSRFFKDANAAVERPNAFAPDFKEHMHGMFCVKKLLDPSTFSLQDISLWNPCLAGMSILYTIYCHNLELGCQNLDVFSQLKALLHIAHAIKERGGSLEEYPFIFSLEVLFGESKSIWAVRPKPGRGNFAKHFWLAVGMRPEVASKLACETNLSMVGQTVDLDDYSLDRRRGQKKFSDYWLEAGCVSNSYQNLGLRDFSPYSNNNNGGEDWLNQFRHRVSESVANMDQDRELLSCNLISLGGNLFEFYRVFIETVGCRKVNTRGPVHYMHIMVSFTLSLLDVIETLDDPKVAVITSILSEFFSEERTAHKYEFFV